MMGTSIRMSKGVSCWPTQFLRTTRDLAVARLGAVAVLAGIALWLFMQFIVGRKSTAD
jgi:hypothetical protein